MSVVSNYSYFEGRDGRERPYEMNKKVLAVIIAGIVGFTSIVPGVSVSAAPEGLERVQKEHPDVQIYCAHIDDHLNENKYIVPGLGDAGDRIFGTK